MLPPLLRLQLHVQHRIGLVALAPRAGWHHVARAGARMRRSHACALVARRGHSEACSLCQVRFFDSPDAFTWLNKDEMDEFEQAIAAKNKVGAGDLG